MNPQKPPSNEITIEKPEPKNDLEKEQGPIVNTGPGGLAGTTMTHEVLAVHLEGIADALSRLARDLRR